MSESRAQEIGRELFRRTGRGPAPWRAAWWHDRAMDLSMSDPEVKVQLFRFTDVLPALRSPASLRRHLDEYLAQAGDRLPWWMQLGLAAVPRGEAGDRLLAEAARFGAGKMARRFITGSTPEEATESVLAMRRRDLAFTVDLLGEAVITEAEADLYQESCLKLLGGMAPRLAADRDRPLIDTDAFGPIPRLNLSLKLTNLTTGFDAIHADATAGRVLERLRPILRSALRLGAFIHVDMEQYAYKDLTHRIFRDALMEPEFRDWPHFGIVVQAYLREAQADLDGLLRFARERGTPITIRLVKGAYWDYEIIRARELGWPIPVWTEKWQSDASFERCTRFLLDHHRELRPALGSHNIRSLAHGIAAAEERRLPTDAVEFQVLRGMGEPIAEALRDMGRRARIYSPYGAMLPGMSYLVRRLLENTSNESFLKASHGDRDNVEDLLRNPEEVGAMWSKKRPKGAPIPSANGNGAPGLGPFRNEPLTDFARPENQEALRRALDEVRGKLGISVPALIGGKEVAIGATFDSTDPGDHSVIVGRAAKGTPALAAEAIAAAEEALPAWSATPPARRAEVLFRAAAAMRRRKSELTAWEILECAKPWREADADVAEAIDFCEFYGREMIRLADDRARDVPGETNRLERLPRGVAVVIPPWNFPLAIPAGMTVAALVAGNTVVLKPSENSPVMAWHLAQALREAGLPPGVLNLVPGYGDVGAALVADPRVALIAFTGSRAVGLEINRTASATPEGQHHVKRVIAEMGGKNAIIVDDDADLDEAVLGVLRSAFGYSGQKCSACSRAIVLDGVYDQFVARLAEAAHSLRVGPAADPDTDVGPVIDRKAAERIRKYQASAEFEGRVVARLGAGPLASRGNYVGPLIVADVRPDSPLAQEEIFGPVLAILRAGDLDEALEIANGTAYALTGGLYSRSPAHIEEVRRRFLVGNLYINRTTTGALVDRQPFGGFKLSGIGTKAGGPDYLLEFMLARSVTENTMRRGFAPEIEEEEAIASSGI